MRNLRAFREECGLSQTEAADEIGILVESLRRYEQGRRGIAAKMLPRFAECYGHDIADFYLERPPPAKLEARPVYFLRMRKGAAIPDQDLHSEIVRLIQAANNGARQVPPPKRPRPPTDRRRAPPKKS